ncbi:centromere protein F isoform X5 [Erinaceus europaeus]|uniref:Centromere protein F isoform X5 n=1 Tax=Erinaceus europaeus TaxID=9365 RepID=A0ABM3WCW6_ERIEU|nr:centromere protein F isoform X5 [Erinaceus europaeus]
MSWAVEEWKDSLSGRALQKVQELEGQLDRLKKERQQRQFQLETLEAALQKQKQKVEDEKSEGVSLRRENQSLAEACENLEKARQKISHELQVKESQVNFQEGQLNSSRKQIEQLEQELKRCKSELERSQQSADASQNPGGTPQKLLATPLTPSQYYHGSKYEELQEKYQKEVEARKRLEAEVKVPQAKRASPPRAPGTRNHRDIARHQASSSVFPWQQEQTPGRVSSSAQRTPLRRDAPREWEATPGRSALRTGKRDANGSFRDSTSSSQAADQLKAQNQDLRSKITELELCLQGQEKEMKNQGSQCQELQVRLEKVKAELTEKERLLSKRQDEVTRTTAQLDQASAKGEALEQKLRKLTEDLSCQRQNAESARCSLEQKLKEKEKEFQQELNCQQRAFQALAQEGTQVKARLTQELQQAKSSRDGLQAELDKVTSAKQQLEQSLEEWKQKSHRTEQALQGSRNREKDLQGEAEEAKKEVALLRSQWEHRAGELRCLEAELRTAQQGWSQSRAQAEELRVKSMSQEASLRELQEKLDQQQGSAASEKLELALAELQTQWSCSQDLLRKREHHIEQLNGKLSTAERESEALLGVLELQRKELEALKEEAAQLSRWKRDKEQLLLQVTAERDSLQSKGQEYSERVAALEMAGESLEAQVRGLQGEAEGRAAELEAQQRACGELRRLAEEHREEAERTGARAAQLTQQVADLEQRVRDLLAEMADRDRSCQDLRAELDALRSLPPPESAPAGTRDSWDGPPARRAPSTDADAAADEAGSRPDRVTSPERREQLVPVMGDTAGDLQTAEPEHQSQTAEVTQGAGGLQVAPESRDAEQAGRRSNLQLGEALRALQELQELQEAWGSERKLLEAEAARKDEHMAELAAQHSQEKLSLLRRCEEAGQALEELWGELRAAREHGAQLEGLCEDRLRALQRLEEAFAAEQRAREAALPEADALRREIRALEEARHELQTEARALQLENEQLRALLLAEHELSGLEPNIEGPGDSGSRCGGHSPPDGEDDAAAGPPARLEAQVRCLGQEGLRPQLPATTELGPLRGPPAESSHHTDSEDGDKEPPGSQGVRAEQLVELQTACDSLREEKARLLSQLSDARAHCVSATSHLAGEVDRLVAQVLGREDGSLSGPQGQPEAAAPGSCESLGLVAEEVQARFAGLLEKVASLQRELGPLLERHWQTRALTAQPQSRLDTGPGPGDGCCVSLSSPRTPGSPRLRSPEDPSCRDPERLGGASTPSGQAGRDQAHGHQAGDAGLEDGPPCGEAPCVLLEEMERLCRARLQALRWLEEQEAGGRAPELRAQELEHLLGALESLRAQQLAESERWRQRLARVTQDLAAERLHTEHLAWELEAARLQFQGLDLSSRSWLAADLEDALRGGDDSHGAREPEVRVLEAGQGTAPPGGHQVSEDTQGVEMEETAVSGAGHPSGEESLGDNRRSPVAGRAQRGSEDSAEPSLPDPCASDPQDLPESRASLQLRLREAEGEKERLLQVLREQERRLGGLLRTRQLQDAGQASGQLAEALREAATGLCLRGDVSTEEDGAPALIEAWEETAASLGGAEGLPPSVDMVSEEDSAGHLEESQAPALAQASVPCEEEASGLGDSTFLLSMGSGLSLPPSVDMVSEEDGTGQDPRSPAQAKEPQEEGAEVLRAFPWTADLEPTRAEAAGESPPRPVARLQEGCSMAGTGRHQAPCPQEEETGAPGLASGHSEDGASKLRGEIARLRGDTEGLRARLGAAEQALEEALEEKAEATGRLSSTREEVRQLRAGMERLRVRIEADERRRRGGERQRDALQERLERLERELQAAEEQQELAILDAESARAEAEDLRARADGADAGLRALRAERDSLAQRLQAAQDQLSELEAPLPALRARLAETERDAARREADWQAAEERLRGQLRDLGEEVAASCGLQIPEAEEDGGQGPDAPAWGVHRLREGIMALTARLHAAEQEQCRVSGRLQEGELRAGLLQGRVEELQRELEAAGGAQERLLLEAEGSRVEAEQAALRVHGLESELAQVRSERDMLTQDLEKEQSRVCALETRCASLEQQLQEMGHLKGDLDARLQEVNEEMAAREQGLGVQVAALEEDKARLLQGLREAEDNRDRLQTSLSGLRRDVEAGKAALALKEEELAALSARTRVREQQLSVELSQAAAQKAELEREAQVLQDSIQGLQQSREAREQELQRAKAEISSLTERVSSGTAREAALQRELRGETRRLMGELQSSAQEAGSLGDQLKGLLLENGELKRSLGGLQRDQVEKEGRMREEVAEGLRRLQAAEQKHQALLEAADKQHESEIQMYQEKLASQEGSLSSQKVELDLLRSRKEELAAALEAARERLEELQKAQTDSLQRADRLKKESERAQGKVKLLIKSCRQLEEEKEALQKELVRLEATPQEARGAGAAAEGASLRELEAEVKELQEALEEKGREAEQYLEKYCALLISQEKLEKEREMLETQVLRLSAQQPPHSLPSSPALSPGPPGPSPPAAQTKPAPGKRQRPRGLPEAGGVGMPATPETLPKKTRRSSRRSGHLSEDTELEPEGLPEVVRRGFSDIPTGKTSPYVLRRSTMATRTSPRLAALAADKENLAGTSGSGARVLKVKAAQQSPTASAAAAVSREPEKGVAESLREGLRPRRGHPAPSPEARPPPLGGGGSSDNCRVQ